MLFQSEPEKAANPLALSLFPSLEELETYTDILAIETEFLGGFAAVDDTGRVLVDQVVDYFLDRDWYRLHHFEEPKGPRGYTDFAERLVRINGAYPDHSYRFTALHELCHVLNDHNYCLKSGVKELPENHPRERRAKDFARVFLLPRYHFVKTFQELAPKYGITNEDPKRGPYLLKDPKGIMPHLAKIFGAPTFSIGKRIKELKLMDPERVERFFLSRRPHFKVED